MAQVMTEWERSLEEFGSRRERKGHAEGRAELLISMARRKFGAERASGWPICWGRPPTPVGSPRRRWR